MQISRIPFSPSSPNVNILRNHRTVLQTSKLALVQYSFLNSDFIWASPVFPLMSFFSCRIHRYFNAQIVPDLAIGTPPPSWFFVLFAYSYHFWGTSFLAQQNIPGPSCTFLPQPWSHLFFQDPLSLWWGMIFRN